MQRILPVLHLFESGLRPASLVPLHAGMAEWLKRRPRDLKKIRARTRQPLGVTPSWVRIPLPAPEARIETERFKTICLSRQVYSFLNLFQKCCLCLAILAAFSTPASISAVSDCPV